MFLKNNFKILVVMLLGFNSLQAVSLDFSSDDIHVENAYVRGLPPTVKNTSAYMTIINSSSEPVELLGAKTTIAMSIMIHRTQQEGVMMSMHHVKSLIIPAHGELVLEPGGTHLMLMGLMTPVSDGGTVELILQFEGGEYSFSLPVRSVLLE